MSAPAAPHIYGVCELNRLVKSVLDGVPELGSVCVRGEISNYRLYPSGHHYFTLKDAEGAIRCVFFRGSAQRLRFRPENGMRVLALGRVSLYPKDGSYQLYCEALSPDGAGDLHAAFEQLRDRLFREGLFDLERKRPLPPCPQRVALITSPAGAAVHDMCRILRRRYPLAKVLVVPVRVQGEEAPPEIVSAIRYVNERRLADVIITGRGGGSMEDLWCFNDEAVARAICGSEIPVISAVGHEPDVTIADFAADVRAATPTHAAELAVPDREDLLARLRERRERMAVLEGRRLALFRQRLTDLAARRVLRDPLAAVGEKAVALDRAARALGSAGAARLLGPRRTLDALAARLDAMSPLKVLGRGYALASDREGRVLRSALDVPAGSRIRVTLAEGALLCRVEERVEERAEEKEGA